MNNGAVPIQTVGPAGTKILFIVDGKKYEFTPEDLAKYNAKSLIYMSCDKMTVYEQGNAYAEKTRGKGYGKVAVLTGNASIRIVDDPFGDKDKAAANIIPVQNKETTSTISNDDLEEFSKYISRNVKYPTADRLDSIGGRVITLFAVDDNGNLQYAKAIRTPSEAMGNEVMRVLKKWPKFSGLSRGCNMRCQLPIDLVMRTPTLFLRQNHEAWDQWMFIIQILLICRLINPEAYPLVKL
ncbi:hypothetical protein HK413_11655 [Mucilaginibacter sp. S1162]|uniref:TonB C-terminal domain-containing protein n=1 Tax=Mucilaginibacter humi TaxID=2732510 RepID=A0ABX1W797_9SPHI|nr:energy transducer TonB [Mucilaginibacter humi]NNU34575.1 hypothetical protein [Mucilaginibacter humi]